MCGTVLASQNDAIQAITLLEHTSSSDATCMGKPNDYRKSQKDSSLNLSTMC